MVAPIVVAAGIAAGATVIGGLINAYQAGQARNMEKDKLKQIENVIRSLVPPDIEISPEKLLRAPQLILDSVELEPLNYDKIKPAEYRVIRNFVPEVAPLIEEQAPQLVEQSQRGEQGEAAFMEALNEMRRVGRAGGEDPIARAATTRAMEEANREAQGRSQAIMQDMARRGMSGSGAEIAQQLTQASGAMDRAGSMAQMAQADAYARQLQAMRDAGRMGRELGQDELALAGRNTDIINSFNQRTTTAAQRHADQAASTRNAADLRNLGREEQVSDANEAARYDAQVGDRDYFNDLAFRKAGFQQGEFDRQNRTAGSQFDMDKAVQDDLLNRQMIPYDYQKDLAAMRTGQYQREADTGVRHAQGQMQQVSDTAQVLGQFGSVAADPKGAERRQTPRPAPSYGLTEEQQEREKGKEKGYYVKQ